MKKTLLAITMVLVLGGWAFAQSSRTASYRGWSSSAITPVNSNDILDQRGGVIYNMTLNAGSSNAVMTVYDSGNSSNPTETPIYEIEVATAGNSASVDFSTAPLNTVNGITASVTNGVGYMNIQK